MVESIADHTLYSSYYDNQFIPVFALIQLLTSGGPNYSTSTIMYYLYEKAFKLSEYGYANTMGVFLAVLIALISFAQFKILGDNVEY